MRFSTLRAHRAPFALTLLVSFVGVLIAPLGVARAEDPSAGVLVDHPEPLATPDVVAPRSQVAAPQVASSPASPAQVGASGQASDLALSPTADPADLAAQAQQLKGMPAVTAPAPDPGGGTSTKGLPTGADKTGVSSQAISVPQGAGKIQGMGESFSAQLSTGIATFSVPFALPPARGAAQPSLGLSYSSAMGHGVAGLGWDMGVPYIARQTDRGLPGYDDKADWHPQQDHFVFNGGQELVPICTVQGTACAGALTGEEMPSWGDGWQYFRPRVEGGFLRFFWSPDHRTWRVQDKSGVLMELGQPCTGSSDSNALETDASGQRIFRWNLARQFDLEGELPTSCAAGHAPNNAVVYRYRQDGGMAYLQDIYTTSPVQNPGKAPLSAYAHHTRLVYENRTDPTTSYRRGWAVTSRLRLARVDVSSKSFAGGVGAPRGLVRRYHLTYDPSFHASQLKQVQVEGRCHEAGTNADHNDGDNPILEQPDESLPSTSCPRLPPMTFEYEHVEGHTIDGSPAKADLPGYEAFDERVTTLKDSPKHSLDEELTDLFDVNSDGLPDVLVTAPGVYGSGHGAFLNGGSFEPARFWSAVCPMTIKGAAGADASVLKLSNLNVSALDLDADGRIDLLHMPQVKTYSVFSPVQQGTCGQVPGWSWQGRAIPSAGGLDPTINFGKDAVNLRVVDINGDGLVDVVQTAGTQMKSYLSLGHLPGGDGQFGRGHWTSATSASLSPEPIGQCMPWAGLPVVFSDPDVKLADMNGDGLADLVRVRQGDIRYWPGRGNGLFGTGNLDDCPPGTFSQDRSVSMTLSPQYADPNGSGLRLDDVNGDGLDDLVQIRFNTVDVWLNVDGTGWTKDRHIISDAPTSPDFQNRVRLVDMNGSGTRDVLWGDGLNYRMIDLAGGQRPGVLTKVANGLGKTTELTYTTSTQLMLAAQKAKAPWTSWTPFPVHVVIKSVERDNLAVAGRPAGVYTTEYSYRDAVYDGRQREFRGFREAIAKRLGDANSPTSSARSVFLLGECEQVVDGKKTSCPVGERWKDNPHEALKGLPVVSETFDEKGTYLSTAHHTYGLRTLYTGRDGRRVSHAFEKASDTFLYDTAPFTPAKTAVTLNEVEIEGANAGTITGQVELRSTAGRVRIQGRVEVDLFGNRTKAIAQGCTAGCPLGTPDEEIHSITTPGRPAGDPTGWLWRTTGSHVQGAAGQGERRHESVTTYDTKGRPISTGFVLAGSLPLDRFHAQSKPVAPAPGNASVDTGQTPRTLSTTAYDDFGHAIEAKGVEHRCRNVVYDTAYADLPTEETIYAGLPGDGGDPFSCGGTPLTSRVEEYDRGLGAVLVVVALHGEETRVEYDPFGRLRRLFAPYPEPVALAEGGQACPANNVASVLVDYELTNDPVGQPFSWMHTRTQDGASANDGDPQENYNHAWAVVDGMGRTMVTLAEADPDPVYGDGHKWIVQGLTDYDAKGAARKAYLPWFWDGSDVHAFPLAEDPTTSYGRQRYDAFGRQVQTFGLDGTVTLQTKHHALSTDAWDAADLEPGPHQGTYASASKDGHGRALDAVERIHAGNQIEERHTLPSYLPTGEVALIRRHRGSLATVPAASDVVRWMRYDSQGRMVLNVEPNTTVNFSPDPATSASAMKAWRYAYSDAGDLVGTSDARGCGANYHYDSAGRLLAEDYSPCAEGHADYSVPNLTDGHGTEVFTTYDVYSPDEQAAITDVGNGFNGSPLLLLGRVASVRDRGAFVLNQVDCRGRVTAVAKRIVKPGTPTDSLDDRFAPRWYVQTAAYDGADRVVTQSTGVSVPELLSPPVAGGKSEVHLAYTANGKVKQVGSSYGPLVHHARHDADGKTLEIQYGDAAETKTSFTYDDRRRVRTVQTYRGPPDCWTAAVPPPHCMSYHPYADYTGGTASTFQLLLEDSEFTYDSVDNPVEIKDWRLPHEWPAGAKPVSRSMAYDDLYRLTRIDYQYSAGEDEWVSPHAAEVGKHPPAWGEPPAGGLSDPRRAQPSPHMSFPKRVQQQTYAYDWLGNTTASDDDAHGFYDRSLGTITNGGQGAGPYQLTGATNLEGSTAGPRRGSLSAKYDAAGNLVDLAVNRVTPGGECLPAGAACHQRFLYMWDEVGRLSRARRWDTATIGTAGIVEPSGMAAADLQYHYDGSDQRVIKTATDEDGDARHTAYIFGSLELRRSVWVSEDYAQTRSNEVGYLVAGSTQIGRLQFDEQGVPSLGGSNGTRHVLLELADHLGSGAIVLDQSTGELVERTTYQSYGSTESDYRPSRWAAFMEDYRFTGKEEDIEVGLSFFGKRYLSTALGRWISSDPLTIHALGADANIYAYVHGRVLATTDPVGLAEPAKDKPVVPEGSEAASGAGFDPQTGAVGLPFAGGANGSEPGTAYAFPEDRITSSPSFRREQRWDAAKAGMQNNVVSMGEGVLNLGAKVLAGPIIGPYLPSLHLDSIRAPEPVANPTTSFEQQYAANYQAGSRVVDTVNAASTLVLPNLGQTIAQLRQGVCFSGICPCFVAGTPVDTDAGMKPIEAIDLGDRVGPESIACQGAEFSNWLEVHFRMVVDTAGGLDELEIYLLRPPAWLALQEINPGRWVQLHLDDLNVGGMAYVTYVGPGRGRLSLSSRCPVTGLVRHGSSDVLTITLVSGEALGVTSHHRLFSATRGDWVEAGSLRETERLRTWDGDVAVQHTWPASKLQESVEVFNLEVFGEHQYWVGGNKVLAHNTYGGPRLFPNMIPSTLAQEMATARAVGVKPELAATAIPNLLGQRVKWAVTATGELKVIPHSPMMGLELSHAVISEGKPVQAAGEAFIERGADGTLQGDFITSWSGHFYKGVPSHESAASLKIGEDLFAKIGITFKSRSTP